MYVKLLCLLCGLGPLLTPCESVIQLTATPTESYFFSPNYPQKYGEYVYFLHPVNLEQTWLLTASDPSHVIHLEVVDSEIEADSTCLYDYVQVHDGRTADDPVIGRFCGKDAPTYVTSGRSMFIIFKTDGSGRYMGFYIRFYSSTPSVTTQQPSTATATKTSTPPPAVTSALDITTTTETTVRVFLSSTSLIGILIAVAFCLTVLMVIVASICIHNSNRVQPKSRRNVNEEKVWQRINSGAPKPRRPIIFSPESDLSSRSTTSTSIFNTSTTSGFSSGAPCSPSTLNPIIAQDHLGNHHFHTLSPVPEVSKSIISDDTDGRVTSSANHSQYAYLDMMELSPRRLEPLRVPHNNSINDKLPFAEETRESDATSTPRSDHVTEGLPNALRKAREARRERYKRSQKNGEDFERGHAHTKHSLINRIDLVRCGMLTGGARGVPRVDSDDATRKTSHSDFHYVMGSGAL